MLEVEGYTYNSEKTRLSFRVLAARLYRAIYSDLQRCRFHGEHLVRSKGQDLGALRGQRRLGLGFRGLGFRVVSLIHRRMAAVKDGMLQVNARTTP